MIEQDEYSNFKSTHKEGKKRKHGIHQAKYKHQQEQANEKESNSDY